MRKHPKKPKLLGPLKTSFELTNIIQTLAEDPDVKKKARIRPGLAVPYSDLIALLQQMCEKGAIRAQFVAGDLTHIEQKPVYPANSEEKSPQ